ncbi:carboxylesterase [Alkalicoccus urumqiensis]|uniref:Carboxylesterase n=2 Tax=Alkalicoccus urumqiensis TaxID=1548213 RepID=A0A2P6MHD7_ALKUR|nr:carboxylesterase [Alkalicoccus urumqiensis]
MIGCLIVHGFTGTPQEVEDIREYFAEKLWLVYTPELPGHDGTKESLKAASYQEWVYKAQIALEELLERCDKVYVIGFSMGGVIAGYLAANYPVDKLVLISSAAYYLNPKQLAEDLSGWVLEGIRGELEEDDVYQFYRDKVMRTPISATFEFAKLVRKLRAAFHHVTVPVLIVQGEKDGLVPARSARYIYEQIKSEDKQLFFMEEAKHYIWYSDQKDTFLTELDRFLTGGEDTLKRSRDSHDEDSDPKAIHL